MTIDRRLLAGALSLSLLLAACGGSSGGGSSASNAPAASQGGLATITPTATEEPVEATEAPAESQDSGGGEASLAPGSAPELEAMLPSEAAGVKFEKTSFDGASLGLFGAAAGLDSGSIDPILKANGKTFTDVSFAIAVPADTTGTDMAMIYAFRIKGVPAEKFVDAMGIDPSSMTESTVGGKKVLSSGGGGIGVYVYYHDDVLFEILLASDKVAEAVLSQLP